MKNEILGQLARENPAAKLFFTIYSARKKSYRVTTVSDVLALANKERKPVSSADVTAFFAALVQAEAGRTVGDSFHWFEKAHQVSRLAFSSINLAPPPQPAPLAPSNPTPMLRHTLHLRPDLTLNFELPADLSPFEAQKIGLFVQALPFESSKPAE